MNLKEAFRYKHTIEQMINNAVMQLSNNENVLYKTKTIMRSQIDPELEDIVREPNAGEWYGKVGELIGFSLWLLDHKLALSNAILEAKKRLSIDTTGETDVNVSRRNIAVVLQRLAAKRNNRLVLEDGGKAWKANNEGTQVPYTCDCVVEEKLLFHPEAVRKVAMDLLDKADEVSANVDRAMIEDEVEWTPPFSVNNSFREVFEIYMNTLQHTES